MVYLNDLANPDIVAEVRKRLEQIEIDGVLESNYLGNSLPTGGGPSFRWSRRPKGRTKWPPPFSKEEW